MSMHTACRSSPEGLLQLSVTPRTLPPPPPSRPAAPAAGRFALVYEIHLATGNRRRHLCGPSPVLGRRARSHGTIPIIQL